LGVGAARFGANTMLDLLRGEQTERTALAMMRTRPVPFPPEPARSAVIQLTRASIARADRRDGRRDLWLRTLDRLGLGEHSRPGGPEGRTHRPLSLAGVPTILITGAAGQIGSMLRSRLARPDRALRLL